MDRIMTKTLAEIYLRQGHLQEAYEIFRALSEKDPFDEELKKRLRELNEKMRPSSPPAIQKLTHSTEEKIRLLEEWLVNIRKRCRG